MRFFNFSHIHSFNIGFDDFVFLCAKRCGWVYIYTYARLSLTKTVTSWPIIRQNIEIADHRAHVYARELWCRAMRIDHDHSFSTILVYIYILYNYTGSQWYAIARGKCTIVSNVEQVCLFVWLRTQHSQRFSHTHITFYQTFVLLTHTIYLVHREQNLHVWAWPGLRNHTNLFRDCNFLHK